VSDRAPTEAIPTTRARAAPAVHRTWIAIAIVVGGLIIVDVLAQGLDRAVGGEEPGGATGSSFATAPDGLAALGSLLSHYGYAVESQRGAVAQNPPPADATAFVLEPRNLTADDAAALLQFATAGGRLIVGGAAPFYLRSLSDTPPRWKPDGATTWTEIDPVLGNVRTVEGRGVGSWSAPGNGRALVGDANAALVTQDHVGRGEILFLADASPLENEYLASADNAALGLALAGEAGRAVVFPEGVHGYGTSHGLGALPDRWKIALLLIAVAALAFVWSRARRFGPPDQISRDLPPARAEYVQALSISLERTHDPTGAFAPAQRSARAHIATRAGIGANANDEELDNAARRFGCSDEEIAALRAPVSDDASILALGRAVARVSGGAGNGSGQ
jgi:Domain of unknown function (DUF4350)